MKPQVEFLNMVEPSAPNDSFGLFDVFGIIFRYKWLVLVLTIAGAAVGYALHTHVPVYYKSTAALISDTGQARILELESHDTPYLIDPSATNTVVETIQTNAVVKLAISELPPEIFNRLLESGKIRDQMSQLTDITDPAATEQALLVQYIQDNLQVTNSGRSYVVYISFRSTDPKTAAVVSNLVANAYLKYRSNLRESGYGLAISNLDREIASQRLGVQNAEFMAETARAERRVLTQRSSALSGPQMDSEIAQSAKLYARQREAEREADALASIYENTLRSQLLLKSGLAAPEINVQLFSEAVEPLKPSGMNMKPVLIVFGAGFGFLLAVSIGILHARSRG